MGPTSQLAIPATARHVSFECDLAGQRDIPWNTTIDAVPNRLKYHGEAQLSSSAPSAPSTFFAFNPFSGDEDDADDQVEASLSDSSIAAKHRQVRPKAEWSHPAPNTQNPNRLNGVKDDMALLVGQAKTQFSLEKKNHGMSPLSRMAPTTTLPTPTTLATTTGATTIAPSAATVAHVGVKSVVPRSTSPLPEAVKVKGNARSLPLSMVISDGQQGSGENVYVIPSKCRMVFHMRDEVSRDKKEEDKTGLCGKKPGLRPQQQPRRYQDRPQYPLKKSTSRGAKCVTFKEPERLRDGSAVASTTATAVERVGAMASELEQQQTKETLEPPIRRLDPSDPPHPAGPENHAVLFDGTLAAPSSTLPMADGQKKAKRVSFEAQPQSHRPASAPATHSQTASSATRRQGHHRNLSAPTTGDYKSSSSPPEGLARSMSSGQAPSKSKTKSSTPPSSGNRFSRLWKSVAQKYGHHNHHASRLQAADGTGSGTLARRGSDLEPLVAVAK